MILVIHGVTLDTIFGEPTHLVHSAKVVVVGDAEVSW